MDRPVRTVRMRLSSGPKRCTDPHSQTIAHANAAGDAWGVSAIAVVLVGMLLLAGAPAAAAPVPYPSRTPPLYYTDSELPYCALVRTVYGATTTFQVDTQGRQNLRASVMMAARAYNITTERPYAGNGMCSTYVGDNGTNLPFVTMSAQTESWACGDRLITCGSTYNNQTVDVNTTRCPTCTPLPFAILSVTINANWYFSCGYPMTVVCSKDPIVSAPTYLYVAMGAESTMTAHGTEWEQRTWGDGSSAVVQGEPRRSITVVPSTQRVMSAYAVNASWFDQTQPLGLGPATANSSMCTITSLAEFKMSRVPAGTRLVGYSMLCEVPAMKAWGTIALLSTNCLLDALCAGFTGRVDQNGDVVPDCVVQRSSIDNDIAVSFDRVLHLKSRDGVATDVCDAQVAHNGSVSILVEGLPANGYFDIFVNDVTVGRCVTQVTSARCGTYFACATILVTGSSTVRVVPSSTTGDSTCGYAARVIFAWTPTILPANFTPPTRNLAAANLVAELQPTYQLVRQISLSAIASPTRALIYVAGAERVAFAVAQSGFACPSCTQPALTGAYFNQAQTAGGATPYACGGNLTFASNIPGLSGQCKQQFLCGDAGIQKADPASPGYVRIGGDFLSAFINGAGTSCQIIAISVWAKPSDVRVKPRSTFLIGVDSQYFRTGLVDWARSGNPEAFAAIAFANSSAPYPALSLRTGIINFAGHVYDVAVWTPVVVAALAPTVTMACIMDFLTSFVGGYCLFRIPYGATNVVVSVENSNYVTSTHRLLVRITSSTSRLADQVRLCGGNRGFYGADTAENGACGSFVRCTNDTLKDTNGGYSYRDVSVYVPAAVAGLQPCAHTSVVLATFTVTESSGVTIATQRQAACHGGGGIYCLSTSGNADDYLCIVQSSICDGVRDCRFNNDEADCASYAQVEDHRIPPHDPANTTMATAYSVLDCQRLAIVNGSALFAFSLERASCLIFTNRTEVNRFIVDPFLEPAHGYQLLANLSSRLNYGRCSDAFTCHGNGVAQPVPNGASGNGQVCGCVCHASHVGEACANANALGTSSTLVVRATFNQSVGPSQIGLRMIEYAIAYLSPDPSRPSYVCQPFFEEPNATVQRIVTTLCAPSVATAFLPSMAASYSISAMNTIIRLLYPTLVVTGAFLLPSPGFQIMNNCSMATTRSVARCAFFQPQPVVSILVTAATLVDASVVVEVVAQQFSTWSRRLGGSGVSNDITLLLNCTPPPENKFDSCFAVACVVALPPNVASVSSATASIVHASNTSVVLAAKDMCTPPSIVHIAAPFAGAGTMPLPNQIVSHEYIDTSMKAATAVVGSVVVVLLLVALPMYHQQRLAVQSRKAAISDNTERTELHTLLKEVVAEVSAAERSTYFFQRKRTGVLVGVVLVFLAATLSIMMWVTLDPRFATNTNVVLETYPEAGCDTSALAPNPSFAVTVFEHHQECQYREAIGSSSTMVPYLAAYCQVRADGSVVVMVRSAFTVDACRDTAFYPIPEGTCVPSGALWGPSADASYLVARCGSADGVARRASQLSGGATQHADDRTFAATVTSLPPLLRNNWTRPVPSDPSLTEQVFLAQRRALKTLSSSSSRTATLLFDGTSVQKTVFGSLHTEYPLYSSYTIQIARETFSTMGAPWYHPESRSIDLRDELKILTEDVVAPQRALAAPHREFPVGVLFNLFNNSRQVSGPNAQIGAHHYYNIAANPHFDIGKMFNRLVIKEGGGATVTFNLLATSSSLGFAFAVTDAYLSEDAVLPALDKLQDMIVNYRGTSAWYNDTLSVYFAVFVDGPSSQLVVTYANPSRAHDGTKLRDANQFVMMPFALSALGQERLFNGVWHRVDLVLSLRNGQAQMSLIIDGVTSNAPGWTNCMPHDPQPIVDMAPGTPIRMASATHRFYDGGVLVVGAFNGGIQGLETSQEPLTVLQIRLKSSKAVRDHTEIDTTSFTALGAALLCIAGVCVVVILMTTVRHMIHADDSERAHKKLLAFLNYGTVVSSLTSDTEYQILSCNAAMRLLGAQNHDQFSAVLDEAKRLEYNEPIMMTVMALMYARGQGIACDSQRNRSACIDPDTWNAFVEADWTRQAILRSNERCCCLGVRTLSSWLGEAADEDDIDDVHLFLTKPKTGKMDEALKPEVARGTGGGGAGRIIGIASSRGPNADGQSGTDGNNVLSRMANDPLSSELSDISGAVAQVSFGLPMDSIHMVGPMLHVLQMVFLWVGALSLPELYLTWFSELMAFVSVELVAFIPHFPLLASVYVQLVCGAVLALLVTYFLHADWDVFRRHVVQYWSSRDRVDHVTRTVSSTAPSSLAKVMAHVEARATVRNPLLAGGDTDIDMHAVAPAASPSLPPRDSGALLLRLLRRLVPCTQATRLHLPHVVDVQGQFDDTVGRDDANVTYVAAPSTVLPPTLASSVLRGGTDVLKQVPLAHTGPGANQRIDVGLSASGNLRETTCTDGNGRAYLITAAGPYCPYHLQRPLGSETQTDVFPVDNAAHCCLSIDGKLCACKVGVVYRCGMTTYVRGDRVVCQYALCERHFRCGVFESVRSDFLGFVRRAQSRGVSNALGVCIMLASNAFYTPFVKTALMIVARDPYFQCLLKDVRLDDPRTAVVMVVAWMTLVLYGICYPAVAWLYINARRELLRLAFFAPDYRGFYVAHPTTDDVDEPSVGTTVDETSSTASNGSLATLRSDTMRQRADATGLLRQREWSRYVSTDPTAASYQYRALSFDWMAFNPLLLVVKAALIVPVVFAQQNSLENRGAIAGVELCFMVLLFHSNRIFNSPLVDLMYRLGSVHQLLFLGIECFDVVARYHTGHSRFGSVLVTLTLAYLVFCCCCFAWAVLRPPIARYRSRQRTVELLQRHGLRIAGAARMLLMTPTEPTATNVGVSLPSESDGEQPTTTRAPTENTTEPGAVQTRTAAVEERMDTEASDDADESKGNIELKPQATAGLHQE